MVLNFPMWVHLGTTIWLTYVTESAVSEKSLIIREKDYNRLQECAVGKLV